MSGLDWVMAAVLLISVLLAASQGFLFELFSLAGVVVGYLLAAWEYQRVAAWYAPYVKAAWVAEIAGFLTIFIAVVLLAGIAGRLARWSVQEAGLRWADRLLGGAFGLVRGLLLTVVLVMALAAFAPGSNWLAQSQFSPYVLAVGRAAVWVAPSDVRQRFRNGMKSMQDLKDGKHLPAAAGGQS